MKTIKLFIVTALFLISGNSIFAQEAMNYADLQNYLPSSISGYVAGEPGGASMNMQGMSFSSADIEFTNSDDGFVRITLIDYSAAFGMYQAATALWTTGMSFEDDESMVQSVQWSDNIVGWEEYRKIDKEANLALGIGDRFFLSIEANNQSSMEFVKNVAKDMDLDGLASQ